MDGNNFLSVLVHPLDHPPFIYLLKEVKEEIMM
jgi:hypothetical protein